MGRDIYWVRPPSGTGHYISGQGRGRGGRSLIMSQLSLPNPPTKPCGILMIPLHWQSIFYSPSFKFCWRQLTPPPFVSPCKPCDPLPLGRKIYRLPPPPVWLLLFFRPKLMNLILFESVVLSYEMLNLTSLDFSREKLHIHSCTW